MNNPYAYYHYPYSPYYGNPYYPAQNSGQHVAQHAAQYGAAPTHPYTPSMTQTPVSANNTPFFNITNPGFIKGAAIGAVVAYLLTNETVQHNAIKASVKSWSLLQGGIEEIKERFRDAEAELHTADMVE